MSFDIESHWAQLIGYIEEGLVVPVIGSGLLNTPGPDGGTYYSYLAKRVAERLGIPPTKLPAGVELNEVACRHLARRGDIDDIYSTLFVLARDETLPVPEALTQLASIPNFRLFVTTNFTSFMTRALDQVRFNGECKTEVLSYSLTKFDDLRQTIAENPRPVVYHLLGKLSSLPSFAVTNEDILEFVRSMLSVQRLPQMLYSEVEDRCLLILGCRFHDWLARFFLRAWRNGRLSEGRTRPVFVADREVAMDKNLIDFLKVFSRGTTVFPIAGPVEFVAELHSRWMKVHPGAVEWAAVHRTETAAQDSRPFVFISYASEDRAPAQRMNDALHNAGIDTFFDKEGLEAGENWEIKLRTRIERCSLFVPVISRNVLIHQPRFFRLEWNLAIKVFEQMTAYRSKDPDDVFLVPVVIDGTPPDNAAIPQEFAQIQWTRLPGGETNPDFISRLTRLYRRSQLTAAGAP